MQKLAEEAGAYEKPTGKVWKGPAGIFCLLWAEEVQREVETEMLWSRD